nr:Gag-Pol polyprotein [Tanacetum cinerariifolium]
MANLQQASSSGTQTDITPVYGTDGSAKVHENYDNNEIFNMFTQEEQYTELLEPIPEPQQVPQNDNNVISEATDVAQDGETVEQNYANFEETRALYESLYQNLAVKVEKVNSVNRKLQETNADLITELARKMVPEPGDANHEITVTETFHLQTDDELYDKELKQIEADDQAIQTILLGLPEDIYAAVDSCETAHEVWLRIQQMMKGSDIGIQEKKAKLFNEWERAECRESDWNGLIGVQGNENQNQIGNGNLVEARAEENAAGQNGNQKRCYNCRGVGHYARNCIVRPRRRDAAYLQTHLLIAQKKETGIQLQAEEYDLVAAAADLDEIEEVNVNCILMANLQQASTSGTQTDSAPVYDTDGSAEVHENLDDNEIFNMFTQEEQYT